MFFNIHSLVPSYSFFYVGFTICKTKNHKVMKSNSVPAFKDTVAYLNTQGNTENKLTWKWTLTNKHPWNSFCSFFYNRYPRIKKISKDNVL